MVHSYKDIRDAWCVMRFECRIWDLKEKQTASTAFDHEIIVRHLYISLCLSLSYFLRSSFSRFRSLLSSRWIGESAG